MLLQPQPMSGFRRPFFWSLPATWLRRDAVSHRFFDTLKMFESPGSRSLASLAYSRIISDSATC